MMGEIAHEETETLPTKEETESRQTAGQEGARSSDKSSRHEEETSKKAS